jgi:hypothetical protein
MAEATMFTFREDNELERVKLESSCDPGTAEEFMVWLEAKKKVCFIACSSPYNEKTDPVLREYYDHVVDRCVSRKMRELNK